MEADPDGMDPVANRWHEKPKQATGLPRRRWCARESPAEEGEIAAVLRGR